MSAVRSYGAESDLNLARIAAFADFRFRGLPDFSRKIFSFPQTPKINKQTKKKQQQNFFVPKVILHDRVVLVKLDRVFNIVQISILMQQFVHARDI